MVEAARRSAGTRRWPIAVLVLALVVAPLTVNAFLVDAKVRAAAARTGGMIMGTGVVPANVKVEGEGLPTLLIHGFGAAMDWWDDIAPALAADHRVIRVDLIGHGGTEAPPSGYTIERQATLVASVLDKLGIARVIVIGHSMGGEVGTALAEANPARIERMVLIDTPPGLDDVRARDAARADAGAGRADIEIHVRCENSGDADARICAGLSGA